jgi:hypothetical protein
MMSQLLPSRSDSMDRRRRHRGTVRRIIPAFIVLAVVLFLVTEGVLYYRWATMNEPACMLIVNGGEQLKGAKVTVSGPRLPEPYVSVMGAEDRYVLPFHLEPDRYTIEVTMRGTTLFKGDVELTREQRGELDLTKLKPPPATGPAEASTQPSEL